MEPVNTALSLQPPNPHRIKISNVRVKIFNVRLKSGEIFQHLPLRVPAWRRLARQEFDLMTICSLAIPEWAGRGGAEECPHPQHSTASTDTALGAAYLSC